MQRMISLFYLIIFENRGVVVRGRGRVRVRVKVNRRRGPEMR